MRTDTQTQNIKHTIQTTIYIVLFFVCAGSNDTKRLRRKFVLDLEVGKMCLLPRVVRLSGIISPVFLHIFRSSRSSIVPALPQLLQLTSSSTSKEEEEEEM